jgi:hypothetical protein
MTIDLRGVSFHLVEDVDLIGATEKHLFIDQRREKQDQARNITIRALTRVLPTAVNVPAC